MGRQRNPEPTTEHSSVAQARVSAHAMRGMPEDPEAFGVSAAEQLFDEFVRSRELSRQREDIEPTNRSED